MLRNFNQDPDNKYWTLIILKLNILLIKFVQICNWN